MRAAVLSGPGRLEVRDVGSPPLAAGMVRLAVTACGICGSNLHEWRDPSHGISVGGEPQPGATGHEIAAKVVDRAAGVTRWEPGDRVVVEPNLTGACLQCDQCTSGRYWFCRNRSGVPVWGFSEEMVVPQDSLYDIPDGVSDQVATLVEPLACAVHAVRRSSTALGGGGRLDDVPVVVLGGGVAGLLAAVAARYHGARDVSVVARYGHQASAAQSVGANLVVTADDDDLVATLRDLRPGLVIEAVGGSADTLDLALRVVAPSGEVVVLGLFDAPQVFDARRAVFREIRMFFPVTYGVADGIHDFDVALGIAASKGELLERLISHTFDLEDVDGAFRTAADKTSGALRVVVVP